MITLKGIDQAIADLNFSNPKALKARLVDVIRQSYTDESSVESTASIDTDELVKILWDTGDDRDAIKSRRKNFNSVKSALNADLKKLYQQGQNPEGIVVGADNTFVMSEEAKDKILLQYGFDIEPDGAFSLDQMAKLLAMVNEILSDSVLVQETNSADGLQTLNQLKDQLQGLSEKIDSAGSGVIETQLADERSRDLDSKDDPEHSPELKAEDEFADDARHADGVQKIKAVDDCAEEEVVGEIEEGDDFGAEETFETYEEFDEVDEVAQFLDEDAPEASGDNAGAEEETDGADYLEEAGIVNDDEAADEFVADEVVDDFKEDDLIDDEAIDEIVDDEELEAVEAVEELADDEVLEDVEAVDELAADEVVDDFKEDDLIDDEILGDDEAVDEIVDDEELEAVEELADDEVLEDAEAINELAADEIVDDLEEDDLIDDEAINEIVDDEELEAVEAVEELADDEVLEDVAAVDELAVDEVVDDLGEDELTDDEAMADSEEADDLEADESFEDAINSEADMEAEWADDIGLSAGSLGQEYSEEGSDTIKKARLLAEEFDGYLGTMDRYFNQYLLIPEGEYIVGCRQPRNGEKLVKKVRLAPFYIGRFPIINGLFEIFAEKTGYKTHAEKVGYGTVYYGRIQKKKDATTGLVTSTWNASLHCETVKGACWYQPSGPGSTLHNKRSHPVVQITIEDAMAFAAWTGKRLPTEKEWEAAARTSNGWSYPWGQEWQNDSCNLEASGIGDTTPVDQYVAFENDLGIADTLGNALEWTLPDLEAVSNKDQRSRRPVAKGGSWISGNDVALFSSFALEAESHSNILGFRCVAY